MAYDREPRNENSLLTKIIAGVVSANFTIMVLLFTNIYAKLDKINDKIEASLIQQASISGVAAENKNKIGCVVSDLSDLQESVGELEKQYAALPDRIKINFSRLNTN